MTKAAPSAGNVAKRGLAGVTSDRTATEQGLPDSLRLVVEGDDRRRRRDKELGMKKIISLVACLLVLASTGIAEAREAPAATQKHCSPLVEANTLKMEVEAQEVVVPAGGTARFLVTVTRGVDNHNDPRRPAKGAEVWILLSPEWRPAWGGAITDETGTAVVTIRIPRRGLRGWLEGVGRATISYGEKPCRSAEESDGWAEERVVRIASTS